MIGRKAFEAIYRKLSNIFSQNGPFREISFLYSSNFRAAVKTGSDADTECACIKKSIYRDFKFKIDHGLNSLSTYI